MAAVIHPTSVCPGVEIGRDAYDRYLTVDGSAPFDTVDHLPFDPDSKIVRLDGPASLRLTEPLPAVGQCDRPFPRLLRVCERGLSVRHPNAQHGRDFQYHNMIGGYALLSQGEIDVMFGAYP